jgi:hypothetical protein
MEHANRPKSIILTPPFARNMTSGKTAMLAIVIALVVVVGGVGVYLMTQDSKTKEGTVLIYVKDAPENWTHINVTFSEVKIHAADGDNESGWLSLKLNETTTLDLASLTNVSELLAFGNVSEGKYTQIRIVVIAVNGTMTDGTNVTFKVPSGELKTTHPFNVTGGENETLTFDFDLARCIKQTGNGDWIFTPVIGSVVSS